MLDQVFCFSFCLVVMSISENVYCDFRDGRGDCSDICLPNVMGRSCRCPDDVPLELNDRTCTNGNIWLVG